MNEDFLAILIAIPLCIAALVWYYRTDRGKKDLKDLEKAQQEFEFRFDQQIQLRKFFAQTIFQAAQKYPSRNFVIRPHPCSDPRWWTNYFWKLDNVHVLCLHSIDPWLHAASMMISISCTSALQSIIANTPVIELTHPTIRVSEHNRGYAHKFTPLFASDGAQLIQLINSIGSSDSATFVNLDTLSKYWYKCFSSSVADDFAALLSSYYSHSS